MEESAVVNKFLYEAREMEVFRAIFTGMTPDDGELSTFVHVYDSHPDFSYGHAAIVVREVRGKSDDLDNSFLAYMKVADDEYRKSQEQVVALLRQQDVPRHIKQPKHPDCIHQFLRWKRKSNLELDAFEVTVEELINLDLDPQLAYAEGLIVHKVEEPSPYYGALIDEIWNKKQSHLTAKAEARKKAMKVMREHALQKV